MDRLHLLRRSGRISKFEADRCEMGNLQRGPILIDRFRSGRPRGPGQRVTYKRRFVSVAGRSALERAKT